MCKKTEKISHDWYTHILHTTSRGNGHHKTIHGKFFLQITIMIKLSFQFDDNGTNM